MAEDEAKNAGKYADQKSSLLACRQDSQLSLDKEMYLLNKKMENIQLECETIAARHEHEHVANESSY